MSESPMDLILDALANIDLDALKRHLEENPPPRGTCKWCGSSIVESPWFSPSGTFHLAGWMHVRTETSSCGIRFPYRFAEPEPPSVGCLRCGCSVGFVGGGYRCGCGWAAPLQQSGLDEFHPESTMNTPEENA